MTLSSHNTQTSLPVPILRRAWLQRGLEVTVSLAFLALALRGLQWQGLWEALRGANYLWLFPGIAILIVLLFVKTWRWQLLFRPEQRVSFVSAFTALSAGYLASNVLPARLGEAVRLVLLISDQPVSAARTLSTIVVERLLDVLSLLIVLVVLLPFVRLPTWMTYSAQALGVAALAIALGMVVLSYWKERLLGWARWLSGRAAFLDRPVLYDALGHLVDGFAALRTRWGLLLMGLSLAGWVGVTGVAWSAGQAFGLALPLTAAAFAVVVTTLGMLLPSSPGYIGVFHGLVIVALAPFGVPREMAFSYALVWHGVNYVTLSASGAVALWVHGTSLGQVLHKWRQRHAGKG